MSSLHAVNECGQSVWLNYLRRALIESGQLRQLLEAGIRGIILTPSVVQKAIISSSDYDPLLEHLDAIRKRGSSLHEALLIDDVQRAADLLYPVFDASEHTDGCVTLPLHPELAHNAVSMVAEATRLGGICAAVDRSNIMVDIPATPAGIQALRALIGDGCNVRATNIFSLETYEQVVEAYLQGMEAFLETHSVWRLTPSSAASVSVSTVDWVVDQALERLGRHDLQGKTGMALAKLLYAHSRKCFTGQRWQRLAQRGARQQRLLWLDTAPRRFDSPDTIYAESLIGPDTIHALSPATLHAFRDHGVVALTLTEDLPQAKAHLQALQELGIDLEVNWQKPQEMCLQDEADAFQRLAKNVLRKRDARETAWKRLEIYPAKYEDAYNHGLAALCDDRVMCRIWEHDTSIWNGSTMATGAFDWLHVLEPMEANIARLQRAVQSARADGFREALFIAAGGAFHVARIFAETFGPLPYIPGVLAYTPRPHVRLKVFDAGDATIQWREVAQGIGADTLLILCDKSPGTPLLPILEQLYRRVATTQDAENAGSHFMAVADSGSPTARVAGKYHFRNCFLDHPHIHDGYAALTYGGFLPAALTGAELDHLLEGAAQMACNASGCNCPLHGDNVAARLGTVLGALAQSGCRRLILLSSPFLQSVDAWTQALIADNLASGANGLQVVSGRQAKVSGDSAENELYVVTLMEGDDTQTHNVRALSEAGQPFVVLHVRDPYEIGGLLFTWQMAVAVAAYHLQRVPVGASGHRVMA